MVRHIFSCKRKTQAQAVIEIALFGAILIFLIGVILRTHLSHTTNLNHQVRAMKLALQQSYKGSTGAAANSSHNSASVLFIEDRLSPDFNKFNTIDRSPFVANGSGSMSNRLEYPIDFGEVDQNLPIMDVFINGQYFPLTTAGYVFRPIYPQNDGDSRGESCPADIMRTLTCVDGSMCPLESGQCADGSLCRVHGPEFSRCLRQEHEWANGAPTFYTLAVNGTKDYNSATGNFDLLRNNWDTSHQATPSGQMLDSDDVPLGNMRQYIGWQWQPTVGIGSNMQFGNDDQSNYPSFDTAGSLREQTIYSVSQIPTATLMNLVKNPLLAPYIINPTLAGFPPGNGGYILGLTEVLDHTITTSGLNPNGAVDYLGLTRSPGAGNVTGVAVFDSQAGDIDPSYDPKSSPGPQPGLMQEMSIYSKIISTQGNHQGTYLQIKEGKLYNPENHQVVRSISSKDHVDLVSRMIQLSNNTQRFCRLDGAGNFRVVPTLVGGAINPVEACGECNGDNVTKTCFDPFSRILYIRTMIGDTTVRKWFTDVTKGL